MRNNLIIGKRTRVESYDPSQEQLDAEAADAAAQDAKRQDRENKLADIPASVTSVPALRQEVNVIKALLREILGD
jgi:hypothetical protein